LYDCVTGEECRSNNDAKKEEEDLTDVFHDVSPAWVKLNSAEQASYQACKTREHDDTNSKFKVTDKIIDHVFLPI